MLGTSTNEMEFEVALCFRLAACWPLTLSSNRHTCNRHYALLQKASRHPSLRRRTPSPPVDVVHARPPCWPRHVPKSRPSGDDNQIYPMAPKHSPE